MSKALRLLFASMLTVAGACGGANVPDVVGDMRTGTLVLGDEALELRVEIALTPAEQTRGLMDVQSMPDDYGMVFLWSTPGRRAFHMFNTLIPLEIAFWDDEGIVDIQRMEPCPGENCPTYPPAQDHIAAVEVNAGVLESAGVKVGDQVRLDVDG